MTRAVLVALALACAASPVLAQSTDEPQLIFSIGGGIATAGGEHWRLSPQQVEVFSTLGPGIDSVNAARYLRPGLVLTLGATYHRSAHLGLSAEAGYFGIASEQRCAPVGAWKLDPENKNQAACTAAQGAHVQTSLVGFLAGLTYRLAPDARVQPYGRFGAGVGFLANSYIYTGAVVPCAGGGCSITFVEGESRPSLTVVGSLAAGVTLAVSGGYHLRFEARDLLVRLPKPDGFADVTTAQAPVGYAWRHVPVFVVSLDVIFERRRGRRY